MASPISNVVKGPLNWFDTLANFLSGMMGQNDKSVGSTYLRQELTPDQLDAAYQFDWIARKIITIPAVDATRQWREWQAEQEQIELLEQTEKEFNVQGRVREALIKARLYGGACILMGTKDDPAAELIPENMDTGALEYLQVFTKNDLSSDGVVEADPRSKWFGLPRWYTLQQRGSATGVRIHPSRIVRFIGNESPNRLRTHADGWGDPVLWVVNQAVRDAGVTTQSIAQLIQEAKVDFIKVPRLTQVFQRREHSQKFLERMTMINSMKSSTNAVLMDAEEEWDRVQVNFAGMPEVMQAYMIIASGAADIPATRMLGRAPTGLNSTGDSDIRNYYDKIKSEQEQALTPAMAILDEMLLVHTFGEIDKNIFYEWSSLWQMDETQKADIELKEAQAVKLIVDSGVVQTYAIAKGFQNKLIESGTYPGLEAAIQEAEAEDDIIDDPDPIEEAKTQVQTTKLLVKGGAMADPTKAQKALPPPKKKFGDATPRPLYVRRDLLNVDAIRTWAQQQGFSGLVPDMHATILYSKQPVDWMKMGAEFDENITVPIGGPRLVEELGDQGAVVLLFSSPALSYRHDMFVYNGASHDYDEYQPHVTITYNKGDVDLSKVQPYTGKLEFGPEIFEEIKVDGGVPTNDGSVASYRVRTNENGEVIFEPVGGNAGQRPFVFDAFLDENGLPSGHSADGGTDTLKDGDGAPTRSGELGTHSENAADDEDGDASEA